MFCARGFEIEALEQAEEGQGMYDLKNDQVVYSAITRGYKNVEPSLEVGTYNDQNDVMSDQY